jgi:S-sulfo-L-cysteine synthase (3-phospho-L-serine-dependent)
MREKGLNNEVAGVYPTPIRYGVDVAKRWSYAPIPHTQPNSYTGDVSTTEEFARDLGLEAAYVS